MGQAILIRDLGAFGGVALALMSASCGGQTAPPAPTTSPSTTMSVSTSSPVAIAPVPRTKSWFDLDVGDCVTKLPDVDIGEVTVPLVDCATAHRAEVYLRAPVEVDAAIADVADQKCAAALSEYTGRTASTGGFTVTYLIDSNQDRTVDNPLPSTVICLLQAAGGQSLTGSARR
jgi:hypothetical protein